MTDASMYGLGAVLGQIDNNGQEKVIAYASRTLKPAERNYSTIEKEALGIIFGVTYFKHYIWGRKVTILTDHRPLQWLMKNKDTSSRLIRWAMKLRDLNIEIFYKPGK